MEPEPRYTSSQALRVLTRASGSGADVRGDFFTMDEIAAAAECLGIRRTSVIQAASLEDASPFGRTLLLGTQTSFRFRALLDKPVAPEQLAGMIAVAGRQGGQVRDLPGSLEWHQQGRRDWVRVMIAGDALTLDIAAHRSTALGFLQWFGPGAGVLLLGAWYSLVPASGPSPSMGIVLAVAVFGFAVARGAWTKIVEQWHAEMAYFAARLEICLKDPPAEASFTE